MANYLPSLLIARHAETAWSLSGQHTGLTDLPLLPQGEAMARKLGERLRGMRFAAVFTSPLQRAKRTCELAGLGDVAQIDRDLVEWDYGEYEGLTSAEIQAKRPELRASGGWQVFRDGCPRGESVEQVMARADRVISRVRAVGAVGVQMKAHGSESRATTEPAARAAVAAASGDVLVFSSGHFSRMLAVRWLGLDPPMLHEVARRLALDTASLSVMGYEHGDAHRPVVKLWNERA